MRSTATTNDTTRWTKILLLAGVAGCLGANVACAHHRQTPPAVALTTTGENELPRNPPTGPAVVWAQGAPGSRSVLGFRLSKLLTYPVSDTVGDNVNPATTRLGRLSVWQTDLGSSPQKVYQDFKGPDTFLVDGENPAITGLGTRVYFESTLDLDPFYAPNPTNARQVFHRFKDGSIKGVSLGQGTSRNATAPRTNGFVAFDSTSDSTPPHVDTGIPQIWIADMKPAVATRRRITNGGGPSEFPHMTSGGEMIVFQSRADLAGSQVDMGVYQVFAYHVATQTFAQVTFDPAGCERPSVHKIGSNYRVAYTCGARPYFYELTTDQRFTVPTPATAHTTRCVTALGTYFLLLATTADFVNGTGVTPDHQLYVVNLSKRPALPVAGTPALWFPFRGI